MSGIKPRLVRSLKESDKQWVEELDSVLWGLWTTLNRMTGYTPVFMVYGAEAVLPCDIIRDSPRVRMYEEREAELDRQDKLNPKWEGPFIIDKVLTRGAYRLHGASDNHLESNPWNAARLRRFYA